MTTHGKKILVTGATGKTGRRLVPLLRARGAAVTAASRSGEARFDWADPATWPAALDGAAAVYLVPPGDPGPLPEFVARAVAAGTERFVVLSGRDTDKTGEDFGQDMLAAERAVAASGVSWTVLRANNFQQNFSEDLWHAPLLAGRLALPIGAVPEPFIDTRDIADVAAALLTGGGYEGEILDLSGPRALTFAEAVAEIARAAGRPITYVELTPEEYHAEQIAEGLPEEFATALDALFAYMRTAGFSAPTDTVRRVLGREPRDFTDYVKEAAADGVWS
jgi:uncharacterized protein YbjT (DUF2867 family)